MKKALTLGLLAVALCTSCQNTGKEEKEPEWKDDAQEISIYARAGLCAGSYQKMNYSELWYRLDSDSAITVKAIDSTEVYSERVFISFYSNVSYVITYQTKETLRH